MQSLHLSIFDNFLLFIFLLIFSHSAMHMAYKLSVYCKPFALEELSKLVSNKFFFT